MVKMMTILQPLRVLLFQQMLMAAAQSAQTADFSRDLQSGLTNLNQAASHLSEERSKFGAILSMSTRSRQSIHNAQSYFTAAQKKLNTQLEQNSQLILTTKLRRAKYEEERRKIQKQIQTTTSQLVGATQNVNTYRRLVNSATADRDEAQRNKDDAQNKRNAAKKKSDDWYTVCMATIWIPFVNIGTCAKSDHEANQLDKAEARLNSSQTRLRDLKRRLHDYEISHRYYSEVKRLLEQKIEQLGFDCNCRRENIEEMEQLQRKLAELDYDFKNMYKHMSSIVTASNTFTYKQKVITNLRALADAFGTIINRIKAAKTVLNISTADISGLEASVRLFKAKLNRIPEPDDDLLDLDF